MIFYLESVIGGGVVSFNFLSGCTPLDGPLEYAKKNWNKKTT